MSTSIGQEWVRKFGDTRSFALETTVRFGYSIDVEPDIRQTAWVAGVEFRGETWYEFREAAQQTASAAQFNGQRRSDRCQNMEAATAFSLIWAKIMDEEHPYYFEYLSAERLCPRLIPLADNGRFCAAIGTMDYRLRFLYAKDPHFTLDPIEVEMTINEFEIPLVETMKFLESVAKLYELDWRDVLKANYRAHW